MDGWDPLSGGSQQRAVTNLDFVSINSIGQQQPGLGM
jgi:hypothetical protein